MPWLMTKASETIAQTTNAARARRLVPIMAGVAVLAAIEFWRANDRREMDSRPNSLARCVSVAEDRRAEYACLPYESPWREPSVAEIVQPDGM